jgi:ubiquinone/menaquinone biosynthesis C-methylase UbiE
MTSVMALQSIVDDRIGPAYVDAAAAMKKYVAVLAADILSRSGFWLLEPRTARLASAAASLLAVQPGAVGAFQWLLDSAAELGFVERCAVGESPGYLRGRVPRPDDIAGATANVRAFDEWTGSGRALVDFVAAMYPAFLQGVVSGRGILFKGGGRRLWNSYFSAAHRLYHVHNEMAADATAMVLGDSRPPANVLEIGCGTGAASFELGTRLPRTARLTVTDVSRVFTMQAATRMRGCGCAVSESRLDFDQPPEVQGLAAHSFDAIVGVNALHNAANLQASLGFLARLLRPGGALVVSESVHAPGERLHQEFVFNLLMTAGPARFLTATQWRSAVSGAVPGASVEFAVNARGPEMAMVAVVRTRSV